jgi:DNA-binding transcriptional regulator LsrR (DeoR family)
MIIKKVLQNLELMRSFFIALVLLGGVVWAFGAFQYLSTSYAIGQNVAYQMQSRDGEVPIENQSQAQMLFAADMSLRELNVARSTSLIFVGVGMMLAAVGWIGTSWLASADEDDIIG